MEAIGLELALRKEEISEPIETIYFGGGTPSLLSSEEIKTLLKLIETNFEVIKDPEITLEANPDDLDALKLEEFASTKINRLSIGVQSFFEEDLKLMNRSHTASEAMASISLAKKYFENISIDLIYGIPGMSASRWSQNLQMAFDLKVPHLSCYALTVEPRTALENFIKKGIVSPVEDEVAKAHYEILLTETKMRGYENYEFSNFGKKGYHSRNNTAYWQGKSYLGVGPSAHSFDGKTRSWNVRNNAKYIKAIAQQELPLEREILSTTDRYNEYMMTSLRTKWGISLAKVEQEFGLPFKEYMLQQAKTHLQDGLLILEGDTLCVSHSGKFLSDGISSDLFLVNL